MRLSLSSLSLDQSASGPGRTVGLSKSAEIVTDCVAVTVTVSVTVHTTILILGDSVGGGTCVHAVT